MNPCCAGILSTTEDMQQPKKYSFLREKKPLISLVMNIHIFVLILLFTVASETCSC